jgi:hypothetical protein
MALYSLGLNSYSALASTPVWDIRSPATGRPSLLELSIINGLTSSASGFGFGRSATAGTQLGPIKPIPDDPRDPPALSTCAVTWTTMPTIPTQYFRRISLVSTLGAGVIWTFPRGIVMGASSSLSIFATASGNPLYIVNCVVDE